VVAGHSDLALGGYQKLWSQQPGAIETLLRIWPMDAPRLSVILVNYNTTALVVDCLRSLRRQIDPGRLEVILVDNASDEFDAQQILLVWPEVRFVVSATNLGFGQGNNLGAREATGQYFWLLNTDTLVPPDHSIWSLVDFLDRHHDYAAASPLLTDAVGTVQPWQTGYFPALWRMAFSPLARLIARKVPTLRDYLAIVDTNLLPELAADVDQAVAASLIIRRSTYEDVGGFSPEYFFFLEDTDLCRKLRARGWRIRWIPEAHIVHLWGRSVPDPVTRQRMFFHAQDLYFKKWHRPWELSVLRIIRLPLLFSTRARSWAGRWARTVCSERSTGGSLLSPPGHE
jgi:GT2 family glycosyltransferase